MKMVEYEIIILVSWIIDFANFFKFLQKNTSSKFVLQELWGLLQNLSNSFKIWPAKINKAVTTFQALRFRMNRIKQIYVSWKSIMQFTWTIFPNSVTLIFVSFIEKKWAENLLWGKSWFCQCHLGLQVESSFQSEPTQMIMITQAGDGGGAHTAGSLPVSCPASWPRSRPGYQIVVSTTF